MREDRRQIQTAVLGSAESDDPLLLPLEAIELGAFRRAHAADTFWCGLLLGGCGGQLTTKLYTDRVCHFAHHPDPDGEPHECRRRARGVASADHLYVKSAADAWLRGRGEQARFDFGQDAGLPVGSVVDIQVNDHRLRVHLDQTVAPVWDSEHEPVLGTSVPVDRDTLIERWYVHRIRLHSEGTARQVRIGTEAFARPVEWFPFDDCHITERGLSTPAVERIVRAHSAAPPAQWSPGKTQKVSGPDGRAQALLRRLLYGRRTDSVSMVMQVCEEIAALKRVSPLVQSQLDTAVRHAHLWLEEQNQARRELFHRLDRAVTERRIVRVHKLLAQIDSTAIHGRTEAENEVAAKATTFYRSLPPETITAAVAAEKAAVAASRQVRATLQRLSRHRTYTPKLHEKIQTLVQLAATAGERLTAGQAREVEVWRKRAERGAAESPSSLYRQVSRRYWTRDSCPRCHAHPGRSCVLSKGPDVGQARRVPHDERLQPIVDARKAKQKEIPRPWRVDEVACPDCLMGYNTRCDSPGGPHRSRVELAKEYSRLRKPPPESAAEA
ncbi:hypothetical protein AB0M86_24955 [Streptomyces sp. NPDC051639]|uniref:hypothetical protein n=1 Tax=Streptomyces sp. NPDC051639 TaxID=3155671 RepID=UPI003437E08E